MHSIWTRANTVFAFTLTVLSAATLLAFLTSLYFSNTTTPVTITAANARIKSMPDYSIEEGKSDMAMMSLSELFVYLVAEYSTMKNVVNQVVLWDKIVMRTDRQVIMEESINPKYYFLDDGSNLLSHQNVTLILKWNVVPNAGFDLLTRILDVDYANAAAISKEICEELKADFVIHVGVHPKKTDIREPEKVPGSDCEVVKEGALCVQTSTDPADFETTEKEDEDVDECSKSSNESDTDKNQQSQPVTPESLTELLKAIISNVLKQMD
uniref:Signal peptidase complex subunit 3 n=1 Tax=Ditylenchus dipsaci TaxID=166011 RepID=A0A915DQI2_9BILA